MTVTVRIRRRKRTADSKQSGERKPRRQKAQSPAASQGGSGRRRGVPERLFFFLFLALPVVTLFQSLLVRTAASAVLQRYSPQETVLRGPGWAFAVPFPVNNKEQIQELIQCESGGQNISLPDTDGITADGILQFHRGPNRR